MLTIDGSIGEGGGQILRTSLALSLCLQTPVRIMKIRVKRGRPGLARQHLAAVQAAAGVGSAEVVGAELRSTELSFIPHEVRGGKYRFDIGSSGSTSLLLQTVIPALITASGPSELLVTGGTHNPLAPCFDYLDEVFFPVLGLMGAQISARLLRPGFHPAGGGAVEVRVRPCSSLSPLRLEKRGKVLGRAAVARVAGLPEHIGRRELETVRCELGFDDGELFLETLPPEHGPGNVVLIRVRSEHVCELFTGYGQVRVRAEDVARGAASEAREYLAASVPVGRHLADQLLLPLALAGAGSYVTLAPTSHTLTNMAVIERFMGSRLSLTKLPPGVWRVAAA